MKGMLYQNLRLINICYYMSSPFCPTLWPHGLKPARLLCPWGFSRQEYWSGLLCPPPGDLANPGIKPRFPTLQTDSLPCDPPRKPKNTGVGSLSLLQQIFPSQESNQGLLHFRQILYQLSYQESPGHCLLNQERITFGKNRQRLTVFQI